MKALPLVLLAGVAIAAVALGESKGQAAIPPGPPPPTPPKNPNQPAGDVEPTGCTLDEDLPEAQRVYVLGQIALVNSGAYSDVSKADLLYAASNADDNGWPLTAACLRMLAGRLPGGQSA